jgi:hypothetical protein
VSRWNIRNLYFDLVHAILFGRCKTLLTLLSFHGSTDLICKHLLYVHLPINLDKHLGKGFNNARLNPNVNSDLINMFKQKIEAVA